MPRRLALIATSLALVVVLAGCGSDDDSADEKDSTTTTEEEASTTTKADDPDTEESTTPEETTESTEPTDSTETTVPSDDPPTTAFEVPEGADFCTAYAAFQEAFGQVPSDTLENIQTGANVLRDAIAAMEPLAPEELADEMELLVGATADVADGAAAATTVEEAQAALNEAFSNPDFSTAGESVDTYFSENCPQADDDQAEAPETVTPG